MTTPTLPPRDGMLECAQSFVDVYTRLTMEAYAEAVRLQERGRCARLVAAWADSKMDIEQLMDYIHEGTEP